VSPAVAQTATGDEEDPKRYLRYPMTTMTISRPEVNAVRTVRDPHTDRPPVREAEVEDRIDLSHDAVIARISTIARTKAQRDGGLAAVHAVDELRKAYNKLWDHYQETLCDTAPGHSFDCYFPNRAS
jgi:hypothetical protein